MLGSIFPGPVFQHGIQQYLPGDEFAKATTSNRETRRVYSQQNEECRQECKFQLCISQPSSEEEMNWSHYKGFTKQSSFAPPSATVSSCREEEVVNNSCYISCSARYQDWLKDLAISMPKTMLKSTLSALRADPSTINWISLDYIQLKSSPSGGLGTGVILEAYSLSQFENLIPGTVLAAKPLDSQTSQPVLRHPTSDNAFFDTEGKSRFQKALADIGTLKAGATNQGILRVQCSLKHPNRTIYRRFRASVSFGFHPPQTTIEEGIA